MITMLAISGCSGAGLLVIDRSVSGLGDFPISIIHAGGSLLWLQDHPGGREADGDSASADFTPVSCKLKVLLFWLLSLHR